MGEKQTSIDDEKKVTRADEGRESRPDDELKNWLVGCGMLLKPPGANPINTKKG